MVALMFFFFFKQKTAYEMRISDWSSDVCSSDLRPPRQRGDDRPRAGRERARPWQIRGGARTRRACQRPAAGEHRALAACPGPDARGRSPAEAGRLKAPAGRPTDIGRAHVSPPVTNSQHVCRLLLEKKNTTRNNTN